MFTDQKNFNSWLKKQKSDQFSKLSDYLDKKQRRDELAMKNMVQKITENGGNPLEILPPTNKTIFVILADSE